MDFDEINNKTDDQLHALLLENKKEMRSLRFKLQSQQLKTVHVVSSTKKTIARINTVLKSRAISTAVKTVLDENKK